MSELIQVGDLVVVVRVAKCGCLNPLGYIFQVESIYSAGPAWHCRYCGVHNIENYKWEAVTPTGYALRTLKRIPPLSELESEKRDEDITA